MVVGDERSLDVLAGLVVVPDGRGQGAETVQDAGENPVFGMPAVSFQVKLRFERLRTRTDASKADPARLSRAGSHAM